MNRALPKLDEGGHRLPELSEREYAAYFVALNARAPELVPAVWMLIHTGVDVGELWLREVRDFELDGKQPRLRTHREKRRPNAPPVIRRVPFGAALIPELRVHIAAFNLRDGDRMFGMFSRSTLDRVHQEVRALIGRPELRLKDFRHIAAISWRRAGADLEQIREWLGHSTINQTVVYASFKADDDFDAPIVAAATERFLSLVAVPTIRRAG